MPSRLLIRVLRTRATQCTTKVVHQGLLSTLYIKPAGRQSSRYASRYEPSRVARPEEFNYALIQNMGEGFHRRVVEVQALGATFDVVYGEWVGVGKSREDSPVVLCLHGIPATEGAFRPIGSLIAAHGYRVIVVNSPGMGLTKVDPERRYDFSPAFKMAVYKAFLRTLKIESIAMAIGHSSGSHPVASLATDPELSDLIKSVCLLCGTGISPHRIYRQFTVVPFLPSLVYKLMYVPLLGWLITNAFSRIIYSMGFRGKTPEAQVHSIVEGGSLSFEQFEKDLYRITEKQLPTLLIYALDDEVIEPHIVPPAINALGIRMGDTKNYDDNFQSEHVFNDYTVRRVVCFAKGTHRVQFINPQKITHEIVSLLDVLRNNN